MSDDTKTPTVPETSIDWSPHQWGHTRQAAPGAVMPAANPDQSSREIVMVLSDESVDSYGTSFEVKGWRDLRPGGVPLLLSHDRDRLPVGRIDRIERTALGSRKVLLGHARFAPKGASPAADEAYELARAGVIKDVSVGFHPHNVRRPSKDERAALGMPDHGVIFTDTELLEGSLVAVPANKGANVLAVRSADNGPMTPSEISGGNEAEPSLRELVMLQMDRLDELTRAVQALGSRGIGGAGGSGSPKPAQAPKGSDDLYRALLDKSSNPPTRDTDDRRDPSGPQGRQPGEPDA